VGVRIDLDEELVAVLEEVGRPAPECVRELIVLELYREGRISSGGAAELLGWPREEFIKRAGRQGIPYFQLSRKELRREIDQAKSR
jgi:predicted HTH domain antitoxin